MGRCHEEKEDILQVKNKKEGFRDPRMLHYDCGLEVRVALSIEWSSVTGSSKDVLKIIVRERMGLHYSQ